MAASLRLLFAVVLASGVSLALFFGMHSMVSSGADLKKDASERTFIDFVRVKQESQTRVRERRKKQPPKPQKPNIPRNTSVTQQNSVAVQQVPFNMPDIAADLSLSNKSFLGDAVVGMGFGDSDVIPLVRQQAVYPPKALSRKIEGYVTARLQITPEGTVDDVEIIEAKPRGVFEREAIRALYKYKFKPKMADGKPVAQTATQTLEFTLSKG